MHFEVFLLALTEKRHFCLHKILPYMSADQQALPETALLCPILAIRQPLKFFILFVCTSFKATAHWSQSGICLPCIEPRRLEAFSLNALVHDACILYPNEQRLEEGLPRILLRARKWSRRAQGLVLTTLSLAILYRVPWRFCRTIGKRHNCHKTILNMWMALVVGCIKPMKWPGTSWHLHRARWKIFMIARLRIVSFSQEIYGHLKNSVFLGLFPLLLHPCWRLRSNICIFVAARELVPTSVKVVSRPNPQWLILTSILCVSKAWYILFFCAIELHCCPGWHIPSLPWTHTVYFISTQSLIYCPATPNTHLTLKSELFSF